MSMSAAFKNIRGQEWVEEAACRGEDTAIFFRHNGISEGRYAKEICLGTEHTPRCPVQEECLAYALEANEHYGVWGGADEADRQRMKREARFRRKAREQAARRVEEDRLNGKYIEAGSYRMQRKEVGV